MKRSLGVGVLVAGAAFPSEAKAQMAPAAPETLAVGDWNLAPVAEVRLRGEFRDDVDGKGKGLLISRARLGVDVTRGHVETRVVLEDARAVDTAAGLDPLPGPAPLASTGAYEAWAEVHTISANPSFLRAGRQAVVWGDGRLLGAADWSPAGRSLDAIRGRLAVNDWAFELLGAALEDPSAGTSVESYGELLGARAERAILPLLGVDVVALARIAEEDPAGFGSVKGETYTGSLRLHGDGSSSTWALEGAYQFGRDSDLASDRSAWAVSGHLAHTFDAVVLRPTARAGVAYASGADEGRTYRAFDPLLPDVHRWHGAMDLFAWSNEEEASAGLTVVPWTDAFAAVEYRYARLAQAEGAWVSAYLATIGVAKGTHSSGELGHEVDASLRWLPWPALKVEAGYSLLALGDGARAILSERQLMAPTLSHLGYAQATVLVP